MKPTLIVLILAATQTLYAQDTQWPDPVANDVLPYATAGLSHGPLLGGVTDTSVRVWLRMRTATDFVVLYGEQLPLSNESAKVFGNASKASDNAATVEIGRAHV